MSLPGAGGKLPRPKRAKAVPMANFKMGMRAFLFGLLAFGLLALTRIQVKSSLDVAGFVLGAAFIWFLIEKIVLTKLWQTRQQNGPPRRPK